MFKRAGDYTKLQLKTYQNKIKNAVFGSDKVKDFDFEIDSMKNLTNLEIHGSMNIAQYFSKLRCPLANLRVAEGNKDALANCEQVYQVKHVVTTPDQIFTFEQMLRLSARVVEIDIGNLTEDNISNIIRLWQNGKLIRDKVWYIWNLEDSDFNGFEVLRILGVASEGSSQSSFEVEMKNNSDIGKVAKLTYEKDDELQFLTYEPCGKEECICEQD